MISFGILKLVLLLDFLAFAASEQKYLELSIVVDNGAYNLIKKDNTDPLDFVQNLAKACDKFLTSETGNQLELSIVLTQAEVWSKKDLIDMTMNGESDISGVLEKIEDFRENVLIPRRGWSDALLVVTTQDMGSNVGRYYSGGVCDKAYGVGLLRIKNYINYESLAAVTVHELGHGLQMSHDKGTDECNDGCIMSPTPEWSKKKFSVASMASYALHLNRNDCLNNKPDKAFTIMESIESECPPDKRAINCGDGIIDDDETCDCGENPSDECANCCKVFTCQLKKKRRCAQGPCCNVAECKFKKRYEVCGESNGDYCDLDDICTGVSAECKVRARIDGLGCHDRFSKEIEGMCVDGECITKRQQCAKAFDKDCVIASKSGFDDDSCTKLDCSNFLSCDIGADPIITVQNLTMCKIKYKLCINGECVGNNIAKVVRKKMRKESWAEKYPNRRDKRSVETEDMESDLTMLIKKRSTETCTVVVAKAVCGNGVAEEGEDCDCGGGCPNNCCNCCNMDTCKWNSGSECSWGGCCDIDSCKFKSSGAVCSAAAGDCDLDDVCTGSSNLCPPTQKDDGGTCTDINNESAYCYNGECLSLANQCNTMSKGKDKKFIPGLNECFEMSTYATSSANCGLDSSGAKIKCQMNPTKSNYYKCGTLSCGIPCTSCYTSVSKTDFCSENCDSSCECFRSEYSSYGGTYMMGKWQECSYFKKDNKNIMVNDGTFCKAGKVCHGTDCIDKSNYDEILKNVKPTLTDPIAICGNGAVEDGEECDCGAIQCDCCDISTCKFRKSGDACYSYPSSGLNLCTTGVCSGSSKDCTEGPAADYVSCDEGKGQCYSGNCASTNLACKNAYYASKPITSASDAFYKLVLDTEANKFYSSGGYYLIDMDGTDHLKTALLKGDSSLDGKCGALLCAFTETVSNWFTAIASCLRAAKDAGAVPWCYKAKDDSSIELLSFVKEADGFKAFRPVLTDVGTPCTTTSSSPGHCVHDEIPITDAGHIVLLDNYYQGRCVAN